MQTEHFYNVTCNLIKRMKKLVNFHFSLPIYILSRVSSRHSFVYISRSIFLIFLHSSESGSCDFLLFNHDAVQRNMDAR